ncbi:MAG: hypothetical protein NT105_17735 [Verrucomicrobia bacterium]|nr:hypothetical protein [Verrucomicrobiota bacterium]
MNDMPQLRWSDAWLLAAIYHCSKQEPANLVEILATADFINHAIPNVEELQSGLFRLEKAGLITAAGTPLSFQCSPEALAKIKLLLKKSKTLFQIWEGLENNLEVTRWVPGEPLPHPANAYSYPGLSAEIYREAVDDYLKRMRSRR